MAELAPTLNSGIAFEQPVSQPSLLEGVSGLANMFISSQPSKPTVSASNQLAADKDMFYSNLQKGRALIEQGNTKQGERIIQSAYRSFAKRYGREHEDVNTAFSDATGISYDVEVTGSPVNNEAFTSTPEFQVQAAVLQQQHPDASPDQIYEAALQKEIARQQTDLQIAEYEKAEQINWYDVEQTYVTKAQQVGGVISSMLSTAEGDQVITPEEAKTLRDFYKNQVATVRKPVGIDQTKWDKYQEEYIDPLTKIVDGAVGLGEQVGISQDMSRSLQQIVSKATAQGKLPASLMVRMQGDSVDSYESFIQLLGEVAKDGKFAENYNFVANATYDELLNWVTEFEFKTDVDQLQLDTTEFNQQSDKDKRDSLLSSSRLMSTEAGPEQIAITLLETNKKLEGISTRALSPSDFSQVFNPGYFASIDKVFQANPTIGRQIAKDALFAIDSQRMAISQALESEAAQLGLKLVDGKLIPDEDLMPASAKRTVEGFFGGDWDAAWAAEGTDANGRRYNQIYTIVNEAKTRLLPKVEKFQAASAAATQLTETYLTPEVTGLGGDNEVAGSEGEDTLVTGPLAVSGPLGDSSAEDFITRLGQRESSGDYSRVNTLGYTGLLQFGEERLNDYNRVNGTKYTLTQFRDSPAIQDKVNLWHIRDIDKAIDEGGYVEQGWSRDGLRAVAHLGGVGGMKKFAASNGAHSPSDAYGTSLVDYYNEFATGGVPSTTPSPRPEEQAKEVAEARATVAEDLPTGGSVSTGAQSVPEAPQSTASNIMGATPKGTREGISTASKEEIDSLSNSTRKMLQRLQVDTGDLPSFKSREEVEAALESGAIKEDEMVLINGNLEII